LLENINAIKRNTEAVLESSRRVGLEINTEKTEYIIVYRQQIARRKYNLLIANKFLQHVAEFRYLGTVTNQNFINEEMNSR